MVEGAKSISRGEISELMHIAPIRRGMTASPGQVQLPMPFADRLRIVLRAFNERESQGFPNVIRLFGGIHSSHWALIDGDTRLLLCVVFDASWHDYLRLLARDTPALLHLIWSNCEGWVPLYDDLAAEQHSAEQQALANRRMFEFVESFQVQLSFWYAHTPRLTVRDLEWLDELRRATDSGSRSSEQLYADAMHAARPVSRQERLDQALRRYDRGEMPGQPRSATLDGAKAGFRKLRALYTDPEYFAAYREAFGSLDGAQP